MNKKPPNAGKGRPKGSKNKATVEMKAWAREMFESDEWRNSARNRILAGKAPHLEAHVMACLMPRPKEQYEVSGPEGGPIRQIINNYVLKANAPAC